MRARLGDGAGAAVSLGAAAAIRGGPAEAFPRMTPERLVQVEQAVCSLVGAEAAATGERRGREGPDEVVAELLAGMTTGPS